MKMSLVTSAATNAGVRDKIFPSAFALVVQASDAPFLTRTRAITNSAPSSRSSRSELILPQRNTSSASTLQTTEAASIYVVDDLSDLTEWYTTLLEATGYIVRAFNDRTEALAALQEDSTKPDLLITDYVGLGLSMRVDRFIHHCLVVHPTLRILMASGYSQTDMRFSQARPDRFIQKPFTPEEFRQAVRAALTAW